MLWRVLESLTLPCELVLLECRIAGYTTADDMGVMSYSHNSYNFIKCTSNKASVTIFSGQITADSCCVTARQYTSYN